jgi:YidC/Oxa1 family membrane protein insertase
MNKNTVIGLVLIFAILMGYMYLTQPTPEQIRERQLQQDSIMEANRQKTLRDSMDRVAFDTLQSTSEVVEQQNTVAPGETPAGEDPVTTPVPQQTGPFAHAANGEPQFYTIENDVLRITLSAKGGHPAQVELTEYITYDSLPLILFKDDGTDFSLGFFSGRHRKETRDFFFVPVYYHEAQVGNNTITMPEGDSLQFGMRLYANNPNDTLSGVNPYLEFNYTLTPGSHEVGFRILFNGMNELVAPQTEQMDLVWRANLLRQEKSVNQMNGSTIYYAHMDNKVEYLSETKNDEVFIPTRIKWLSFKQAFFTSVLMADEHFTRAEGTVTTLTDHSDEKYLRSMNALLGVPYQTGDTGSINLSFYFGPNKYALLKDFDLALERQIPLGWSFFLMQWINRGAVIPVFNWLETTGMSYGLIILILTLLLKLILFPVAYKMYISSAKMRVLKPEVDEINAKFPKKEDAMKKQQAVMALYRSAGVNPMAGCVPMLLQFPIILAMFRFFPASFELRQQSFLWADDLSTYDSILELGFNIPFYGSHVSLFTLLMTASMILYTKMNSQMMAGSQQMPGMKMMLYLMPVMFLGIFNNYASGLSYYYLLANLITFGQMFIMRRFVDEDKLRAKIQANKKKPKKRSKFQQRLEEMQKQKGYKPSKK